MAIPPLIAKSKNEKLGITEANIYTAEIKLIAWIYATSTWKKSKKK